MKILTTFYEFVLQFLIDCTKFG